MTGANVCNQDVSSDAHLIHRHGERLHDRTRTELQKNNPHLSLTQQPSDSMVDIGDNLYQQFFDQCPVPMALFGRDGELIAHNHEYAERIESAQQREENQDVGCNDAISRQESAETSEFREDRCSLNHAEYIHRAFAGEVATTPPYPDARALDCQDAWISTMYFPIRDSNGTICYAGAIWTDVSAHKKTCDALIDIEERHHHLLEIFPDAVTISNTEGQVIICNQRAAELIGFDTPQQVVGLSLFDVIAPEDRERAKRNLSQPSKHSDHRYYTFLARSNTRIQVETSKAVIRDGTGMPTGYIHIGRDITERVRNAREREAIIKVASALRTASNRSDMIPILLGQIMHLLHPKGVAFWKLEHGQWIHEYHLGTPEHSPITFSGSPSEYCIPLLANHDYIGSLCISSQCVLSPNELRILNAIADMAANALHRMNLFEQTQRHLRQLRSLRAIDQAVNNNLDLGDTLDVLMEQVNAYFNPDAMSVLLFNSVTHELEYATGQGFRTDTVANSCVRVGTEACRPSLTNETDVVTFSHREDHPDIFCEDDHLFNAEAFVAYYGIPLISKQQMKGFLELFWRTPTICSQEDLAFLQDMAVQVALAIENAELLAHLYSTNDELILAYDKTIEGWAHALELRDAETEGHSRRVTKLTLQLACMLGYDEDELVHIRRGAVLHDIGKMAIPDNILLKNGALTPEERDIMCRHPVYAYEWLSTIPFLRPALDIPYYHHERWDGSGYPHGLKGEQIPLAARIFSVVDVWDALCFNRPYREAWPTDRVARYVYDNAGILFDPTVVEVFLSSVVNEEVKMDVPA